MIVLYAFATVALIISFLFDRPKTFNAIKITLKKIFNILPQFLLMIIFVSISLFFFPDTVIAKYLGSQNIYISAFSASVLGSIAVMPGFIAFPLGAKITIIRNIISYFIALLVAGCVGVFYGEISFNFFRFSEKYGNAFATCLYFDRTV
ncbi:MAG: hypothetical protein ACOCUV_03660 [bacterium]